MRQTSDWKRRISVLSKREFRTLLAPLAGGHPLWLAVSLLAINAFGQTGTLLTSGPATEFQLPATYDAKLYNGSSGYRIIVPPGATKLAVRLTRFRNPSTYLRPYYRVGLNVEVTGTGQIVSDGPNDYGSDSSDGWLNSVFEVTATSSPPLQAGTYFIAFRDPGSAPQSPESTSGAITAIISGPGLCAYAVSPSTIAVPVTGTSGSLTVTTASGCAWSAISGFLWLMMNGGNLSVVSGTGSGTVNYSVKANASTAGRTGSITVALQSVAFTQAPASIAISTSSSVTLAPGGASQSIPVTIARDGFDTSVSMRVEGLPSGVTATVSNPGPGNSGAVTLQASAGAAEASNLAIKITASGSGGVPSATATFSLTVSSRPVLALAPGSLQFTADSGVNPPSQTFQVQNAGSALGWTATAQSSGNWLSVSPQTGVAPSTLTVSVSSASVSAGTYTGTITITALASANAINSPQTLTVTLSVGAPLIFDKGIVNGASFSTAAVVSPGSIASLFGVRLAATSAAASSLPLPATLAGAQVLVNGVATPLFFVSPAQINFQMPTNLAGSSVPVNVVSNGIAGPSTQAKLSPEMPGIFKATAGDVVQGAVLNQDSSPNSDSNPATPGSVIQVYATGLGATNPPLITGQAGNSSPPYNNTVAKPLVLIAGVSAEVQFSAVAPGFVGLYQINAVVPASITPGNATPLLIQVNGQSSNTVTVAIRASGGSPNIGRYP